MPGRAVCALLEGALAGLAGAGAMTAVSRFVPHRPRPSVPLGRLVAVDDADRYPDPAAAAVGRLANRLGLEPDESVDRLLGAVIRVLAGVACGAGYGLALEYLPFVRPGTGAVLGALLRSAADAAATPLLGLPRRRHRVSLAERGYAVAPDVAYGVVTDVCLDLLRRRTCR